MVALLGTALLGGLAGSAISGKGPGRKILKNIGLTVSEPFLGLKAKARQKETEELAKQQEDKQKALEAEVETRAKNEESTAASQAAGKAARKRQKARSAAAKGRRSTLLTGPLGLIGEPETAGRTLLGG